MNKQSPYDGLAFHILPELGSILTNVPVPGITKDAAKGNEATQKAVTKPFFLEDQLPHDCDPVTIIKAARAWYPDEMILQDPQLELSYSGEPVAQRHISRWYVVEGDRVIRAKSRKIVRLSGLEQFLKMVESGAKGTVIVSFGREDFRKVSEIVESKTGTGWGTSTQISDGFEYRTHTYSINIERVPPKYSGLNLK